MTRGARGFTLGATALALAIIGIRLTLANREWFYGDDFFFLAWLRDPHWSWHETFLPSSARLIAAYRPLGLDSYFIANFALFGWNALGYYVTGLVLQALTGFGVARIALHYGLEWRVAIASGLAMLIAKPCTTATYEIVDHNYICAAAATTFALSFFLDYLRSRRERERWASCSLFAIAALSNEIAACLPLVAFMAALFAHKGSLRERAHISALALAPHVVVLVLFLDFRVSGVPTRQLGWFYDVDVSLDMVSNTRGNLEYALGGEPGFYAGLALVAAVAGVGFVRIRRGEAFDAGSKLVQLALVSSVWLAATVLPFSVLALPATRFALVLLPPLALLLGAAGEFLLPRLQPAWRTPALLLSLLLIAPWQGVAERFKHPKGAAYRDAHAIAVRGLRANTLSTCVTIVCNGPGLANASQCAGFRDGAFHSAFWQSVEPDRPLDVDYSESKSVEFLEQVRNVHDCVRFYLRNDLSVSTEPPNSTLAASLLSAR
jgi:hypothetical protein